MKIVGVYFSAHWCVPIPPLPRPPPWRAPVVTPASGQHRSAPAPKSPIDSPPRPLRSRRCPPCRQFTPIFGEIYKELKSRGKNFEVVFASSDRDEASFAEYHGEQPGSRCYSQIAI